MFKVAEVCHTPCAQFVISRMYTLKVKKLISLELEITFFILTDPPENSKNPCDFNPCGPNSECRVNNNQAVCSCKLQYIGSPPGCRPECTINQECPLDKACVKQKCTNPCVDVCGRNANCKVVNHSPICTCFNGFTGDPFTACLPQG